MRVSRALLLAGLLLAVTVLWRLPAAWVVGLLPTGYQCHEPSGTVWRGGCGRLQTPQFYLEHVDWNLSPALLLRAQLGGEVTIEDPRLQAHGGIAIGRKQRLTLSHFSAEADLNQRNFPMLRIPVSGRLKTEIRELDWRDSEARTLAGTLQLLDLAAVPSGDRWGSFVVETIPGQETAPIHATVRAIDGPLQMTDGRIGPNERGEYQLDALLTAGEGASDDLRRQLDSMTLADAQGRHELSTILFYSGNGSSRSSP